MSEQPKKKGNTTRIILPEELAKLRDAAHDQRPSLVVLSGWEIGRQILLGDSDVILGRSEEADVLVNLLSVSRQHALIEHISDGNEDYYTVTDLKSMNGTLVNNVPVSAARLNEGDKIQLGDVVFKFGIHDPVESQFHDEVHRRIHYHHLTGLLTLDSFKVQMDEIVSQVAGTERVFTLAMTDLDGLKKINDTYGHVVGSLVISEMGAIIRGTLRSKDRGGMWGGDETILLFPDTPLEAARAMSETLRQNMAAREFEYEGKLFGVSISQGLAEFPRHGATREEIISAADEALYAAKNGGRNCIRIAGE